MEKNRISEIMNNISNYLNEKDYLKNYFEKDNKWILSNALNQRFSWDSLFVTCKFLIENHKILNNMNRKNLYAMINEFIKKDKIFGKLYQESRKRKETIEDLEKPLKQIISIFEILEIVEFNNKNFHILNLDIIEMIYYNNVSVSTFFLKEYVKKYFLFFDLDYETFKKNIENFYARKKRINHKSESPDFTDRDLILDNEIKDEWYNKLETKYSQKNSKRIINKIFNVIKYDLEKDDKTLLGISIYFKKYFKFENLTILLNDFLDNYRNNNENRYIDNELLEDINEINSIVNNVEKERLINSRLGQGKFRTDLLQNYKNKCILSDCNNDVFLVASHIKPWRDSTNYEKLDWHNGLLLHTSIDKLFDKFLISFDDDGYFVFNESKLSKSDLLSFSNIKKNIIERKTSIWKFISNDSIKKFIKYHYEQFIDLNKIN